MRVLYFTRDYTPHDYRFLTSLAEAGEDVWSLRLEHSGRQLEDRPLPPQVTHVAWRGGRRPFRWQDVPALALDLRRVLRAVRPDVVHAGPLQGPAFVAALAGARPLVSMSWGSDILKDADRSDWMRRVTRFALRRSTLLLGDCQAVRDKAVTFGFPADRVVLFPWGVNLRRFTPGEAETFRARLGWQDAFVVLSLRTWEPIYGVDVLVRGFARAAQQVPELRLLLIGGGSQAGLIRSILQQHDVLDRVHFAGQVTNSELPTYYHAADLYVSASHSDGSSVSLMEALACARPVLVSDIPGNLEWIEPGVQGWLFPDGDSGAVCEGILQAVRQRDRLGQMSQAAHSLAESRADWMKNFEVMRDGYRRAIMENRDTRGGNGEA